MALADVLPPLNACLNGAAALCIFAGWRAAKAGNVHGHRLWMFSAVGLSTIFLASYVTRFLLTGAHRYPVDDWTRVVYLVILTSHTLLAITVPFLVGRSIFLALRERFAEHRRIVRFTLPIWGYVSVTGVVIYLMLYQLAPRLM